MNHEAILQNLPLWQGKDLLIEKLPGGLTNFNYLVVENAQKYVARFASASHEFLGIKREQEIANTKEAFRLGVGPEVIAHFPEHGLLIVRYMEGEVFTPDVAQKKENIFLAASVLKKLHEGKTFKDNLILFSLLRDISLLPRKRIPGFQITLRASFKNWGYWRKNSEKCLWSLVTVISSWLISS